MAVVWAWLLATPSSAAEPDAGLARLLADFAAFSENPPLHARRPAWTSATGSGWRTSPSGASGTKPIAGHPAFADLPMILELSTAGALRGIAYLRAALA